MSGAAEPPYVGVVCVGNEYRQDDGFGPAVARYLRECYRFRPGVMVMDRAVAGFDIVPELLDLDAVVLVDALDGTGAPPGTVFAFEPQDMAVGGLVASLHEVRFADVLAAARFMGAACAGRCFGVQVADRGSGALERGLSPVVAAAVTPTARAVARYLDAEWDARPRRRGEMLGHGADPVGEAGRFC